MTTAGLSTHGLWAGLQHLWRDQRVWLASALILAVLLVFDPTQAADSALFAGNALVNTAPFLILSIGIAAFGKTAFTTTLFLAKWLTLAFLLESLMLAWIPAETVTAALGGTVSCPSPWRLW
jgi:hypothetical protein